MADEIIKRDENSVTVGAGVTFDSNEDVSMLRVDASTGQLQISTLSGSSSDGDSLQVAHRDENHRTVCMGWDEENQVVQEILTDEQGNLLVQF